MARAERGRADAYLVTVITTDERADVRGARRRVHGVGHASRRRGDRRPFCPLHGAPWPGVDALTPSERGDARAWLEAALERKERIMGMGHRVYRVRDPRAFVLERAIARLEEARDAQPSAIAPPTSEPGGRDASEARGVRERLELARVVEREAEALLAARHPERALRENVEFYTAVLLEAVGLPRALFTPTFAIARAAGWCAHVEEQRAVGRLIRPRSRYVDAPPRAGAHG